MYSRLQDELEKILIQHNISNETNIFNDVLMKLANVEVKKTDIYGFQENYYSYVRTVIKDNELPLTLM